MGEYPGYIRVNLPSDKEHFISGNGEGVFVRVEEDVERLYNEDYDGGFFKGTLGNDSCYYPALKNGDTIIFTMRGDKRSVCLYDGFLEHFDFIGEEAKNELIEKLCKLHDLN
jgi:hypothetical protein